MRCLALLSQFFFLSTVALAQNTAPGFTGTWRSVEGSDTTYVYFYPSGHFAFATPSGDTVGGRAMTVEGETFEMFYRIDESTVPGSIDLLLRHVATGVESPGAKGVYEFVGPMRMKIDIDFETGGRPTKLDASSSGYLQLDKQQGEPR